MTPQINQKAQEIAFAVLRVAAYVRRKELRQRLESLSYRLVEEINLDAITAINTATALNSLIKLGHHLLAIEPVNAKILEREVTYLCNDIQESSGELPIPDLETIFSKPIAESHVKFEDNNSRQVEKVKIRQTNNPAKEDKVDSEAAIIRQDRIMAIMRQKNKVQLRDLISELPGISERTLRYDLKKLADSGKIERQGSGGPSNFYVLKPGTLPG